MDTEEFLSKRGLEGRWMECVPNFSEGRDERVVQSIAAAARSAAASVLDVHVDPDHNRSVLTLAAAPETLVEAAFRAVERAVELIDLRPHSGVHPRIGAADVVPFVPISGVSMEDCVRAGLELAERLAMELGLPVYLYEHAARREAHRNLASVRKLHEAALTPAHAATISPDLGPTRPHPTAGAVAVGARTPLVAFNCYLSTPDTPAARHIAARVREAGGGMVGVKALGLWLEHEGKAQVSMNLTDPLASHAHEVVVEVDRLARGEGTALAGSELVGLIPLETVLRAASSALRLPELQPRQVLELALLEREGTISLDGFLADLASGSPAPGGGAAGALTGSLGAALASMVCNLTLGRPRYSAVADEMQSTLVESERLRLRLRELMQLDQDAYTALMATYKLPKATSEEQEARATATESALHTAADVPLETAWACIEVLRLLDSIARLGNRNAVSDAGAATLLAEAAARASLLNVRTNAAIMKDRDRAAGYIREMEETESEVVSLARVALATATTRIGAPTANA